MRSKAPAQLLSYVHNKFHFLELYPSSNVPILGGGLDTAWEP
jgi:hypothetical protein